jgi:Scavenger mRNA decapping enzyme C-term binding
MDLNGLYVLGIVRQRGLHTLRDITGEHLPLLKEMYRYGVCLHACTAHCTAHATS